MKEVQVISAFGTKARPQPLGTRDAFAREKPQWKQVHGTASIEVLSPSQACGEVDALWTRLENYPLGVVTADCVPLLLQRRDQAAVAVLHAGWRGLLARFPEVFFKQLPAELNDPREWTAKIGPCIHSCCYEFGNAEIGAFQNAFPDVPPEVLTPRLGYFNLLAPLSDSLSKLELEVTELDPHCTYCAKEPSGEFRHFSYRRGDRLSRQYSMIQISSG